MAKQCLPFLLLLQVCLHLAAAHYIVKFLPGFQGRLPFHLETGYVGVDEAEDVQLFYYFIKSQRNPKEDPLLLWLTGGPGCSSFTGLAFEIGPINFEEKEYNGSLPTWVLNPYSWTQVSSVIFLDLPVGTGFSYGRTPLALLRSDSKQVSQAEQFLRKWLMDHQEFLSNPVYIAGDSYSGIIVPAVVQKISNGNSDGIKPQINLKVGYILGNPITDPTFDFNSRIPFAHGMGLISDELYESLMKSCAEEYQTIKPSNAECLKNVEAFDKCISDIEDSHILERKCPRVPPHQINVLGKRRCLDENSQEFLHFEADLPKIGCRTYVQLLGTYWANNDNVRQALHVREGSIGEWQRCNYKLPYTEEIKSSIKYHTDLGIKGHHRLIYSGDHDMVIPFLGTQAWIRSLNYSIVDDWHPWHFQGQVAGYTRTYSSQLTFATVMAGGHTAPEHKPAECFAMFKRWILQEPL
ncbi:serine carboxypeptidase-like 17 isoform X3 [Populus nigra]|uniref:serine carboxypeptidase-like 17 isoform X3 n=1 Tax=Populus nigra TaxID=3691 RepID=UPI002B27848B|nr:serine carboxypeptidase-like 17 isoform X3 [Populus nigra]